MTIIGSIRQAIAATGDGAFAARGAERYLSGVTKWPGTQEDRYRGLRGMHVVVYPQHHRTGEEGACHHHYLFV
jgi:hypothetical protein